MREEGEMADILRRFRSLRSLHPWLWTFALFGDACWREEIEGKLIVLSAASLRQASPNAANVLAG